MLDLVLHGCRCKEQAPGTTLSWPSAMHVLVEWLEVRLSPSLAHCATFVMHVTNLISHCMQSDRAFSKKNVRICEFVIFVLVVICNVSLTLFVGMSGCQCGTKTSRARLTVSVSFSHPFCLGRMVTPPTTCA
jgi:hypothetical protein